MKNEGGRLVLEDGFGRWRSMFVYFLMLLSFFFELFLFPVLKPKQYAISMKIGEVHRTLSSSL
jgi:hypothetical protein